MSRVASGVNTDHLDIASNLGITAAPLTMGVFYKRTGAGSGSQRLCTLGVAGSANDCFDLLINVATDGVRAETRNNSGGNNSEKTGHTVDSAWHYDMAVYASSSSRTALFDGVAGTTETTTRVPSGIDLFRMMNSPATAFPSTGKFAHQVVYGAALSTADGLRLSSGTHPFNVKPWSLARYWELTGTGLTDLVTGAVLVATGTTSDAGDNPTVSAAVTPAFSAGLSVSAPTTDGYTCAFTANTDCTVHVVALAKGSSTPSAAAVIAHTGALAFASKNVTGADTVTLTGLDFPVHDLHAVVTSLAGTSSVSSVTNTAKTAPTGKQYSTFASVDGDTIYAGISSPSVAAGDIREVDTVMAPSGNALTVSTDGNDSFDSDGSRQSYEARIYDVSAQDWMATSGVDEYFTVWFNNQAPEFLDAEVANIYPVPLSSAMTSVDLAALVSDPEGDTLTVTSGTMPTGLTLASNGTVTGTATVQGIYTVSTEWEDVPGDTLVSNVIWIVGNINVPDVEDALLSDALEALEALYFTASTSTETRSDIPAGVVISQSPTAGSSAAPFTSVALVISEAYVNRRNLTTTRREIREVGRRR